MSNGSGPRSEQLIASLHQNTRSFGSAGTLATVLNTLASLPLLPLLGIVWLAMGVLSSPLAAQTYSVLHDFNCSVEVCNPDYPEILAQGRDGNLYGTIDQGGGVYGAVVKVTPAGVVTTLHAFTGPDGITPYGGLTLGTDGNFYGTTSSGGANNGGTIFKITPSGTLTTLHNFDFTDGANPHGAPVEGRNGQFYGTTCSQFGPWTAYSITSAGKFKLLSSSIPPCPFDGLILGSDGNFYGTSQAGGVTYQGTVFRMTPGGAVKILHSFEYTDGATLYSPVAQGNDGYLYGTTSGGGSGQGGVIFKLSTAGTKFTLLHQYGDNYLLDGSTPYAGLVPATDGKFYGATPGGANYGSVPDGGLFQIASDGTYSLLHAFDGADGGGVYATSTQHTNGTIYGLAHSGGTYMGGVFYSLDMGLPRFAFLMTTWGSAGQTLEILGDGLIGTTSVNFGAASASFNVVSDTYLTATIPADGATGFVTVTTPSGTLTSSRVFKINPVVSGITPASGPVGTVVTITGTGFTGTSRVAFGGVKATSYTIDSGTQITATAPAGAKTGKIAVTTPGGAGSSKAVFTVTP